TASIGAAAVGQGAAQSVANVHVWVEPVVNASALSLGISAGLGVALSGTVADTSLNPSIGATIGPNAAITVANDITVESLPRLTSEADGYGIQVGAVALGASVAVAHANPTITTSVQANAITASHDINVRTIYNESGGNPVSNTGAIAKVKAGSGGVVAII